MDIVFKPASDANYAETLTRRNMANYYQKREIIWDCQRYAQSWQAFDNYEVWADELRVGVIRLSYSATTTFLRDFQLVPEYQGQGIGCRCLELLACYAQSRQSQQIVLRVFEENPAARLYYRFGYRLTSQINGLLEMELKLT